KDGVQLRLAGNISSVKERDMARKSEAQGGGLFRNDFLYMERSSFPTEEEQFEVYKLVAEKVGNETVVIRTLDIGGDKHLDYFQLPDEQNPFLGYRAIRISLDRKDMFKTQMTAILRASHYGNIKMMFPMISSVEEVQAAKAVLNEVKEELDQQGVPYNRNIPVGIMIEVPAAVMIADLLAEEVDFFSIGTNDLVQYVLAVDRMNEQIAHMYHPYHPGVLRMIRMTVEAARRVGIDISVCGEMAADERSLPLWLEMGISDLSMSPQALLKVKHRALNTLASEARETAKSCFRHRTSTETEEILTAFAGRSGIPLGAGAEVKGKSS
ncbi:phosphoenolpyruvate-protein phosphotransferase, partial [Paenibacillus riograndensis]